MARPRVHLTEDARREALKENSKRFRRRHPNKARAYREANRERLVAYQKAYRERNSVKLRAYKQDPINKERAKHYSRNEDPLKRRQHEMRRNARKQSTQIGPVDYNEIFLAANGLCGICNESLGEAAYHFDHIIPLSRGGGHVQDNIQIAHATCNVKKNKRLPEEYAAVAA